MTPLQKRIAVAVLVASTPVILLGVLFWVMHEAEEALEPYHKVEMIQTPESVVALHVAAWGVNGNSTRAWLSLDSVATRPDSTRDVLIDQWSGVFYRMESDTLVLLHDGIVPPDGFASPVPIRMEPTSPYGLDQIRSSPDSSGFSVLW